MQDVEQAIRELERRKKEAVYKYNMTPTQVKWFDDEINGIIATGCVPPYLCQDQPNGLPDRRL